LQFFQAFQGFGIGRRALFAAAFVLAVVAAGAAMAGGKSGPDERNAGGAAEAEIPVPFLRSRAAGPPRGRRLRRVALLPDRRWRGKSSNNLRLSAAVGGAGSPDSAVASEVTPVSPEVLEISDPDASQRLRFEVGDRIFFPPGSAELGSRARILLARQARWLKAWKASAVIAGHGDEGGEPANDERISLERATVVRGRLLQEGIPADRLDIVSLGRRDPVADCSEPACAVQNRRVVIHVMKTGMAGPDR